MGRGGESATEFFEYLDPADLPVIDLGPLTVADTGDTIAIVGKNLDNPRLSIELDGQLIAPQNLNPHFLALQIPPGSGTKWLQFWLEGPPRVPLHEVQITYYPSQITITDVQPRTGPAEGGGVVTIYGSGFVVGDTTVRFNGAQTEVLAATETSLTVKAQPGTPGAQAAIEVRTPYADFTGTGPYTYVARPQVTAIAPLGGPEAGGTPVIIYGSGFVPGETSVKFGSAYAGITAASSTELMVTAPPGSGSKKVTVATLQGGESVENFSYRYYPSPVATSITPATGPATGGNTVTIIGSGFVPGETVVAVIGQQLTPTNVTETAVTFSMPAGLTPWLAYPVIVQTPGGHTNPIPYVALGAPVIYTISPSSGGAAGGYEIQIRGMFDPNDQLQVTFGGTPAEITDRNWGALTVKVPAGSLGPAVVAVSSAVLNTTVTTSFTYTDVPTVSGISPNTGPAGTSVRITGTNLHGGMQVRFGSVFGQIQGSNGAEISVIVPPGTGTVDVTVVDPSAGELAAGTFTYAEAPVITAIEPSTWAVGAGQQVTVRGSGFVNGMLFAIDGGVADPIIYINSGEVKFTTGYMGANQYEISLITPDLSFQTNAVTVRVTNTPSPLPRIVSMSPQSGPIAGGTTVTLYVENVGSNPKVGVDGVLYTPAVSGNTLTFTMPPQSGPVEVIVLNAAGQSLPATFTYVPPPEVYGLSQTAGRAEGGDTIRISGGNFTEDATVKFGTMDAASVRYINSGTLEVTTPSGTVGSSHPVEVTNSIGTSSNGIQFTYRTPPTVSGISPTQGIAGTEITVNGSGFTQGQLGVTVGGTPVNFGNVTDTSFKAMVPPGSGTAPVRVSVDGFAVANTPTFTYSPTPTITSVLPTSGPEAGGAVVTIMGSDFDLNYTKVFFGDVEGRIDSIAANRIDVIAPAGRGAVDLRVVVLGGSIPAGGYRYYGAPAITSMTPATGISTGGAMVEIVGTGFVSGSVVLFDSTPIPTNINSDTSLSFYAPAGTGSARVTVVSQYGTSKPAVFTYYEPGVMALHSLDKTTGPEAGGGVLTLSGANFPGGNVTVHFGSVSVTPVSISENSIVAPIPPGSAGEIPVTVRSGGSISNALPYSYYAPGTPTITDITPASGFTVVSPQPVTIIGINLLAPGGVAPMVFFGSNGATVLSVSDTQLVVQPPANGTAGAVDVTVGSTIKTNAYEYYDQNFSLPPEIASVEPTRGPLSGGTPVVLHGKNFLGATDLSFGGTSIAFTVTSDIRIDFVAPGGTGTAEISNTIYVGRGGSVNTSPATFTQYPEGAPTADSTPSGETGSTAGGNTLTITGSNLSQVASVKFGDVDAVFQAEGDGKLVITAPPNAAGQVTVTVHDVNGNGFSFPYQYIPGSNTPAIGSTTFPTTSAPNTPWNVTLNGANFTNIISVTFGGQPVTGYNLHSPTSLSFTTPVPIVADASYVVVVATIGGVASYTFAPLASLQAPETRGDPSADPDVRATVAAHVGSAERFRRVQSGHISTRLGSLRRFRFGGTRTNSFRFSMNNKTSARERDRGQAEDPYHKEIGSFNATELFVGKGGAYASLCDPIPTRWAFWGDGSMNIGTNDDDAGYDHTTFGLTTGADYIMGDNLAVGMALGYTNDKTDVGNQGSETSGYAWTAALYGSYSFANNFYLEGMLGYSRISLDSNRYTNNGYARGDRNGNQFFASLASGVDLQRGAFVFSPYGKMEASFTRLDGYRERGGGNMALRYGDVDVDTLAASAGFKADYTIEKPWGVLMPGLGMEYSYNFKGDSNAKLGYADTGDLPYIIRTKGTASSTFSVTGGVNALIRERFTVGVEYRGSFSGSRRDHSFSLQGSVSW